MFGVSDDGRIARASVATRASSSRQPLSIFSSCLHALCDTGGSSDARYMLMGMNVTLIRALVALVPTCLLLLGSLALFFSGKRGCSLLQLLGAGCLVVVLTHAYEVLHLFPWMHWGIEHSIGHYLDFWSAVLGLTLFPVGFLFHALFEQ